MPFVPEFQKSVEEEKKEHGDKVSKLLNWVSSVKVNSSKDEKVGNDGKAISESSSKPKVNTMHRKPLMTNLSNRFYRLHSRS